MKPIDEIDKTYYDLSQKITITSNPQTISTSINISQNLMKLNLTQNQFEIDIMSDSDFKILRYFSSPLSPIRYHLVFLSSQLEKFTSFQKSAVLFPFLLKQNLIPVEEKKALG